MALSSDQATPKTQFATPRKIGAVRTVLVDNLLKNHVTPKQTNSKLNSVPNTPECFNSVTVETPNPTAKRRSSNNNNKADQISNLTVAVRIRPMNTKELACSGATNIVSVKDEKLIITSNNGPNSGLNVDHIFHYDHIFWSCDETNPLYSSQEDVFFTIGKPLLNSAFRGYNACLFAYGQTGSGKSFSMMGRNDCEIVDIDSEEHSGLTPRFCRDLFERIEKLNLQSTTVDVSYYEIYNEKIHDLLANNQANNKAPLKVREHPEWGPYVVDLTVHPVKSYNQLRNWLVLGNKNRATAATNMNEKSSRSHSIFQIELCLSDGGSEDENSSRRSKVSLIDLAGSERLSTSHNTDEKIRQGVSINKSLLTLGKVISALADQKKNTFVPYRDSVLTWLLRESLGGNSLTSMLATITPANTHLDETLATLRYACQARSIINRARINENPHDRVIRELKQEVERLKALKQNYEKLSSSNSSLHFDDSASKEELDELRTKLLAAEDKLNNAEENWRQRFVESTRNQLEKLAKSEKRREELESHVRVMKTVDTNVCLSPYKTNFLEELEEFLTEQHNDKSVNVSIVNGRCVEIDRIMDWCSQNGLQCNSTSSMLTIVNNKHKKQTFLMIKHIKRINKFENVGDFLASLTWTNMKTSQTKSELMNHFNQIYQTLSKLQPSDDDNALNLLFAKVNKSLQSYETALLANLNKTNNVKNVTFNM